MTPFSMENCQKIGLSALLPLENFALFPSYRPHLLSHPGQPYFLAFVLMKISLHRKLSTFFSLVKLGWVYIL
jgi:hypothetical protein